MHRTIRVRAKSMRISMLLTPICDKNLELAAQVGVEEIVSIFPGLEEGVLKSLKQKVDSFGMRLTHIERKIPHDQIVHGLSGRDDQINTFIELIKQMGGLGLKVLCYNWMPSEDWCRTSKNIPERGGSLCTGFDVNDPQLTVTDADGRASCNTTAQKLWENLDRFLNEIIPIAEEEGVKLALHPDDPPVDRFWGQDQIMTSIAALKKVVNLVPSDSNGICYCTGSLGPTGDNLVKGIEELGNSIHFVHLRNIKGNTNQFRETWHDNGQIDLCSIIRALRKIDYSGTIRPDHVPTMIGESNEHPGYEMQGRLFAAGYIRGLLDANS